MAHKDRGKVKMKILPVPEELTHYRATISMEGTPLKCVKLMEPEERRRNMRRECLPAVLEFEGGRKILCFISGVMK